MWDLRKWDLRHCALPVSESNASTNSYVIIELVLNGTTLERRRELDLTRTHIDLECWCAVDNELAIYDSNSQQLVLYSFDLTCCALTPSRSH